RLPVQCVVSRSVRWSANDHTLKYGSWTMSGTAGGRCCCAPELDVNRPHAKTKTTTHAEKMRLPIVLTGTSMDSNDINPAPPSQTAYRTDHSKTLRSRGQPGPAAARGQLHDGLFVAERGSHSTAS